MNLTRHIPRASLCLLAGVVVSYGVAWGLEFLNQPRSRSVPIPVAEAGRLPLEWPSPISEWPSWTAGKEVPSTPEGVLVYRPAEGVRMVSYFAGGWHFSEIAFGWPMHSAARSEIARDEFAPWPISWRDDHRPWFSGWPAFESQDLTLSKVPVLLPIRPLWTGLAVNSAFYGCVAAAGAWMVGWAVRANRRRRGLCEVCKYPRGASAVCTECGTPRGFA